MSDGRRRRATDMGGYPATSAEPSQSQHVRVRAWILCALQQHRTTATAVNVAWFCDGHLRFAGVFVMLVIVVPQISEQCLAAGRQHSHEVLEIVLTA